MKEKIITTDDLCLSYLDNFIWFERMKELDPNLKVIAFTIGNHKNTESLKDSLVFDRWYEEHKGWVEIAVHSYDHLYPPDGDRDDEEYWIVKALDSLKPYLPIKYGYRSPGWQTTNKTVEILKRNGFEYIAYEGHISNLRENRLLQETIVNSHLYDASGLEKLFIKFKKERYEIL